MDFPSSDYNFMSWLIFFFKQNLILSIKNPKKPKPSLEPALSPLQQKCQEM